MGVSNEIAQLQAQRRSTRFSVLLKICHEHFGEPRIKGSHHIFKTPWPGDPRLNLQSSKGKAKTYQVDQVIAALRRLNEIKITDKDRST